MQQNVIPELAELLVGTPTKSDLRGRAKKLISQFESAKTKYKERHSTFLIELLNSWITSLRSRYNLP